MVVSWGSPSGPPERHPDGTAALLASPTKPTRRRAPQAWVRRAPGALGGPSVLAGLLAVAARVAGLQGTDQAAQVFRVLEVRRHGLALIDTSWYGGIYPLSYSVAFPVLGAVIGLAASSVLISTLATWAFDRLTIEHLGRRTAGSWYFAVSTLLPVAIGQLPFLAGEAFGLGAMLALSGRRRGLALVFGLVSALCSPLAAAFLAMVCIAWGWRSRGTDWWPVWLATLAMATVGALALAFPGSGYFPFPWTELVMIELLCLAVATPLVRTAPAVRVAVALYAAGSLAAFAVPNPLGGNAGRLATAIGVPLLACFVTVPDNARLPHSLPRRPAGLRHPFPDWRWQRYAGVVLVPFAVWQWAPGVTEVRASHGDRSTTQAFYAPLLHRLADVPAGDRRVEVVPTADHWEAAYVAPTLSLARGWERQIDTVRNPIFYHRGLLTAALYHQWLVANGVRWVALAKAPLDYAGKQEAAMLGSGSVPGLAGVWRSSDWVMWRVEDSPGLVTGPARLTTIDPDQVDLMATGAGDITVRVRWSSYWTFALGSGCVAPDRNGWTRLHLTRAGPVELVAALDPERAGGCPALYCPPCRKSAAVPLPTRPDLGRPRRVVS